jgi:hypothetical protein
MRLGAGGAEASAALRLVERGWDRCERDVEAHARPEAVPGPLQRALSRGVGSLVGRFSQAPPRRSDPRAVSGGFSDDVPYKENSKEKIEATRCKIILTSSLEMKSMFLQISSMRY